MLTTSHSSGLTTLEPHRRVTRAREPNADPTQGAELCTNCWHNGVANWHHDEACVGTASTVYMDLRACDNNQLLPSGQPCKNDSAMWNTYECGIDDSATSFLGSLQDTDGVHLTPP